MSCNLQMSSFKLSLKIMVDTKAKKVVFAEAEKDFVDFIFHLLFLPLNTVMKHLKDKGMHGSLDTICKSLHSLDDQYFEPHIDKSLVFHRNVDVIIPRLSLNDNPAKYSLYQCHEHDNVGHSNRLPCQTCSKHLRHSRTSYVSNTSWNVTPGFVKESVPYMVLDDLEVKPISVSLIRDHVKDFDYLEEKVVEFGYRNAESFSGDESCADKRLSGKG